MPQLPNALPAKENLKYSENDSGDSEKNSKSRIDVDGTGNTGSVGDGGLESVGEHVHV